MAVHPIDDLRAAVEAAAGDLRDGNPASKGRLSLERPKKAGFGDYSTNAAMLLAPALGAPPREVAERLGVKLSERLGENSSAWRWPGPASSTCSWRTPGTSTPRAGCCRPATAGATASRRPS